MGTGVISKTRELSQLRRICPPVPIFSPVRGGKFVAVTPTCKLLGFRYDPRSSHFCDQLHSATHVLALRGGSFLKHQPWQTVNGSVKAQERRGPSVRAQLKRSMRGISHEQTLRALRAYARTGEHYRQRVFSNQPAYVIVHTNLQDPIFLADGKGKDG